jgi:hypothetical protein
MSDSESIIPTSQAELDAVACLINREEGTRIISSAYLRWWYFQNPSQSFSFVHVQREGSIEGLATTNNFRIDIDGRYALAAMPQKVLTSRAVRGKGYFGRLYRQTEAENISHGVDCFLTFTNSMSTPIFLEKFGYRRGISPSVFVVPALFSFFRRSFYRLANQFDENYLCRDDLIHTENSLCKGAEYFKWRYFGYEDSQFVVLNLVGRNSENEGYVILKRKVVMFVPLYVVMDIITHSQPNAIKLLQESLNYAIKNLAFGIMILENNIFPNGPPFALCMKRRNKFNFLVKARTDRLTEKLALVRFNWFAGDLDFF